jgi:hypothetical protein
MLELHLTNHAEARMRQRGFRNSDVDLVLSVGTRTDEDAFCLTDQDAGREIQRRKREIQQLERLRGTKMIVRGDALVTIYHSERKLKRHLRQMERSGS